MTIIGITGQSGSGKGYLANEFAKLGYIHADADKIYHALLDESQALRQELIREFGNEIESGGKIDRKVLGAKVFGKKNARKLLRLNKIAHKYVCKEYIKLIMEAKANGEKGIIIDAPLLIEAGLDKICDTCICVAASEDIRTERIMKRDRITEEQAKLRINSQKQLLFYSSKCEYIFLNDGSSDAASFAKSIDEIHGENNE